MTTQEFIEQSERIMGNGKVRLMPEQRAAYYQKLQRFTDEQLSAIYDKVLELTEHFPKIKTIYDAAQQLGYLETHVDTFTPHTWEPTDCKLCGGEGRISAYYGMEWEKGESLVLIEKLQTIQPYSLRGGGYVFRCSCLAGELPTVEKGLPRWSSNMPAVRRRAW